MRPRGFILGLALLAAIAVPGRTCGPFFLQMVFVNHNHPDSFREFVEGRPLLVERGYNVRSLALFYRILNGPALTPAERKDVIAFSRRENDWRTQIENPAADDFETAYADWGKAHADFAGSTLADPYPTAEPDLYNSVRGSQ